MYVFDVFFVWKLGLKFIESFGKEFKMLYGCDVILRMIYFVVFCFFFELWMGGGGWELYLEYLC